MLGFHIDMNIAHFKKDYLEKWLRELARLGYDTIIWEVENNVQWQTCPECASPEAFSQAEFKELLALCRELKLESIPLLQTLGHCEYVLKHERWQNLAEEEGHIEQYCPRKPEVLAFLTEWIEEYFALFGELKYFHLGADEAWWLGKCKRCQEHIEKHSLSSLYIDHVNAVCAPVLERNVTPVIWADMLLSHPEALPKLSRRIMLFDWIYDVYRGNGKVRVWGPGGGQFKREELPPAALQQFKDFLFPNGDEPGREPEPFYSADFLAAQGFKVVTCPASACSGDNVFAPQNWLHLANTFDSVKKGALKHLQGSVLTSWTVRMHPWELQQACLELPGLLARQKDARLETWLESFSELHFGIKGSAFARACGLLSKRGQFAQAGAKGLGFGKEALPVPLDFVEQALAKMAAEGRLDANIEQETARLAEYREAAQLFTALREEAKRGQELLAQWQLAARNLVNRAEASLFLLACAKHGGCQLSAKAQGNVILSELRSLSEETRAVYRGILKPQRSDEVITWLYAPVEYALVRVLGK